MGLTGEVRAIGQVEARVGESKKMGFSRCIVPESNLKRARDVTGIELIGVRSVSDAVEALF